MRIGPFHITYLRRNKTNGRRELPWDVLTAERLSGPARTVIARMARSEAKDYYQDLRERAMTMCCEAGAVAWPDPCPWHPPAKDTHT